MKKGNYFLLIFIFLTACQPDCSEISGFYKGTVTHGVLDDSGTEFGSTFGISDDCQCNWHYKGYEMKLIGDRLVPIDVKLFEEDNLKLIKVNGKWRVKKPDGSEDGSYDFWVNGETVVVETGGKTKATMKKYKNNN
jgi:hypothetical protein